MLCNLLPWITAAWVLVQLLSLRLGLLDRFFFDSLHADVQGIDYYSLPKAWLNLAAGRSLYATFDPPAYGPHFTWYLAHPLLAMVLGWPLSRFDAPDSYGVFTLFSLALMALCAWLLGRETESPLKRRLVWLLLLGSFPGYDMLFVGNVQAITVLGLTMVFVALLRLVLARTHVQEFLFAGLLIALFSKPVVLLMLPLLLLLRETRRATLAATAVYVVTSVLCLVIPGLNPEATGMSRRVWLAVHPGYVRANMQIYANHFHLTPDMRDNSVHWFNLIAQSGYRLDHVDVISLPLLLDGLLQRRTPDFLYWLPASIVLLLSVRVFLLRNRQQRRESASLLALAASLSFFLSYPTVWEYQYTAVLPVAAVLLLHRPACLLRPGMWRWSVILSTCAALPSPYFLYPELAPARGLMLGLRLARVGPVTAVFLLLACAVARSTLSAVAPSGAGSTPDCSLPAESPA